MKEEEKQRLFYSLVLAAFGIVLAVRGLYGFCWSDESFYLTFAQRLWQGQQLVLDEWHPVQFYSALFYPILSLYHAFFGTEGIYLFARCVYTAAALACSLLLFLTLCRRWGALWSFLGALLVLSYSRGNIWGLSYYNLFVLFCVAAFCLLLRGWEHPGRSRWLLYVLGGMCLAAAVLCVPYFAPFAVIGLLAALFFKPGREGAAWCFGGICLTAVWFLLCFLPKDLAAVFSSLSQILTDPEHVGGPLANLRAAVLDVKLRYHYEIKLAIFSALVLLLGVRFLPKAWGSIPGLLLALAGAAVSFWRYYDAETGYAAYTLVIFCLPGLLLCWVRREIDVPALLLRLLGMTMGLSMALSSNTESIAFTAGLPVYAIGLLLQFSALPQPVKLLKSAVLLLTCAALCLTFYSRISFVFRDGALNTLTATMGRGPAKGLHTTQEHNRQYEEILNMLEELNGRCGKENTVFFTKLLPWGYLACDFPCGAPTAWRTALDSPRLESYYSLHPDSIPSIVVVLRPEIGNYPDSPTPNENALSGWLWEQIQLRGYDHLEYNCADVYVSPNAS